MLVKWEEVTVGELVKRGVIERPLDGNHGSIHPKGNDFVPAGVPFIMASDLVGGGIDTVNCSFITVQQAKSLRKGFAKRGDVLISHKATLGRTALVGEIPGDFVMLTPQVTYYRPKDTTKLNNRYLKYYFDSEKFQQVLQSWAGAGSTRAYIGITDQLRLPITLPPIADQLRIADILGSLDDKIELNRRMNETLEAMARTLFRSWFVDFDPVRVKADGKKPQGMDVATAKLFPASFEPSALGPIPKGWRVGMVRDECLKVENGGTPKRDVEEYWSPGDVPWLTSGEVHQSFVADTQNRISNAGLQNSSAKMWPPFTTVVALYGATAGIATILGIPLCANQACCGLVPNDNNSCYIHQTLTGSLVQLQQQARGSAQQNLSQSLVADFRIVRPPAQILQQFEDRVKPLYARCLAAINESRTLAATRDALLPRLLSGEVSVEEFTR